MIHRKAAIGVGVLVLAGLAAVAVHSYSVKASVPDAATAAASAPAEPMSTVPAIVPSAGTTAVATPVAATGTRVVYRDRVVYRTAAPRYYVHRRSKKHSAEIIGGSALAGAGIGALAGGGKGALIGGLIGGGAGTVYDRATHKKVVRE